MHLFRRARVPRVCLANELASNASLAQSFEPWLEVDIQVDGDRIKAVTLSEDKFEALPLQLSTDLGGVIVFPAFLDCHTHLDKTHTWERAPNPRGEFWDALAALRADAKNWSEEDVYKRASFALRQAWAHGTAAVRTHLDINPDVGENSWNALASLKEEWEGRIELQTVSLFPVAAFAGSEARRIVELSAKLKATALGGFPQPNPDLPAQLDSLMAAARELNVGLDLHVDESALVEAECLRATAEAVLRNEFTLPVACGHCCSLALHTSERRRSTIDLVRAAGLQIISLPLCNQYLQGRQWTEAAQPETPRWRGLTAIHELLSAGVTIASASDNVRDAFYAWGAMDAAEVFVQSVRLGHLDTRMELAPSLVTSAPARIMGLPDYGRIAAGARAEFIVFNSQTFNQFLCEPTAPRKIIRGESWQDRPRPDYRELATN